MLSQENIAWLIAAVLIIIVSVVREIGRCTIEAERTARYRADQQHALDMARLNLPPIADEVKE